jgi:hypothetical protein
MLLCTDQRSRFLDLEILGFEMTVGEEESLWNIIVSIDLI